jgi:hypothetical protein
MPTERERVVSSVWPFEITFDCAVCGASVDSVGMYRMTGSGETEEATALLIMPPVKWCEVVCGEDVSWVCPKCRAVALDLWTCGE